MAEGWPSAFFTMELSRSTTVRTHNDSALRLQQHAVAPHVTAGSRNVSQIRFAHPAEVVIADLLDSFGVRWQYEPTTFPLVTADCGKPVQSFTPDFFLPEHDVYIEMTTMRQSLVTRKNRKYRLLCELYPNLTVRLLYRKDVELIVGRCTGKSALLDDSGSPVVITSDQIARKAREAVSWIAGLETWPVALIALGEGAVQFRDVIAGGLSAIGRHPVPAQIRVSHDLTKRANGNAAVLLDSPDDIRACRRILVADVVGTGLTLWKAHSELAELGVPVSDVITMLDRRSARLIDVPLALPGLPAPSTWLIGAGLGFGESSNLPDIHGMRT